jgi:bifunctional ADP-heptose synthase (sugar kinase/adenylyltransferase)
VIGEAILDQYCYCNPMAKSPKETIVASRFLSEENFAGGTLAIANHLAGLCKNVSLVTTLGTEPQVYNFFKKKLKKNVDLQALRLTGVPTITKRRYVEPNFLTKMFEIQYLDDSPLSRAHEQKIIDSLRKLLPQYDLVVVADYGHGFITDRIREEIGSLAKFLCVNIQTNSANYGFNPATKYHNVNFVSIDEAELKLALRIRYGDVPQMALNLKRQMDVNQLLVSRGPNGNIVIDQNEVISQTPIFSTRVVDRIGAGDALFAITSACTYKNFSPDVIGFIGSCAGALAVEIVCNRDPIDPVVFMKFITGLLK